MKNTIKEAIQAGMTYAEYMLMFKQLATQDGTTGEPTAERIQFTKLNFSRSKRLDKTIFLTEIQAKRLKETVQPQTWLVLTETWCGDAAQTLPFLNRVAETAPDIELRILLRDQHPELMDAFLTNGARAIPKLIVLDENLDVLADWGPRSEAATQLVLQYKAQHGTLDAAFKESLQVWYNKDRGQSILKELIKMVTLLDAKKVKIS
ncbi:thioredoxin family protein [Altibacter sp.]|uniref:thioredoxin family protein n=1 Tax=Altibacter sp. TaxID=2024823 RepID=UPI000C91FDAC|nr:thioredoxin family protein [Altibacter sp.]MAP55065.1 thioredoxin family protein [Altibacter sp.]